jgi:magnesium-protoporphyrin O-methyltransferase
VVVLNRVVCCYPDYPALLGAATAHARRVVAFSFPPDARWARFGIRLVNVFLRLRRCEFRAYVHPERGMLETVAADGFRLVSSERAGIWRVAVLERAA